MIRRLFSMIAAMLLLTLAVNSWAAGSCTVGVSVTNASTAIVAANDVPGGRHYLMLQNTGSAVVFCALATSNAATTTNGVQLGTGQMFVPGAIAAGTGYAATVPNSDVACITGSGTSNVVVCDY